VIGAGKRRGTTTAEREELRKTVLDVLRKGDVPVVTRIASPAALLIYRTSCG
jgi:hypothetical protein